MPNSYFVVTLSLLLILTWEEPVKAQIPPQKIQQDAQGKEAAAQPEITRPVVKIVLENNLLSVELVNASMEEIVQAIAHKAGFSIEGGSSALSKKLTTRFNNLDVDRGIMRLFSLAKETNYLISYDTKGAVSKLEIYGAAISSSAAKTPSAGTQASPIRRQVSPTAQPPSTRPVITRPLSPPARPAPQVRPLRIGPQPPSARQAPQNPQTSAPPGTDPATPEPAVPQVIQEDQHTEEPMPSEDVKEIPYVSPQRKPVYIPPIKR